MPSNTTPCLNLDMMGYLPVCEHCTIPGTIYSGRGKGGVRMSARPVVQGNIRPEIATLLASSVAFARRWPSDQLGTFQLSPYELASVVHEEVRCALRTFLPRLRTGGALSRGAPYYDVGAALDYLPPLVTACRLLAESEEECEKAVALALYENLFNAIAAISFAFWERCCDAPVVDRADLDVLRRLLDALPRLAGLHVRTAVDEDLLTECSELDWELLSTIHFRVPCGVKLRRMREFDAKVRVMNEVLYIGAELCMRHEVDVLVFPLYSALTLASYFVATDRLVGGFRPGRPMPCMPIRLGFYNLGGTRFLDAHGAVLYEQLMPIPWIDDALQFMQGKRILIIDDNTGVGKTLRACKQFVRQVGGEPLSRSAETSWELFRSLMGHDLSDAVDFPSLRSNFSYAAQCAMAAYLQRGAYDRYANLTALAQVRPFRQQLHINYVTAKHEATWQPAQLEAMTDELGHALVNWEEPGYPLSTVRR
jgi:hypothetical protein